MLHFNFVLSAFALITLKLSIYYKSDDRQHKAVTYKEKVPFFYFSCTKTHIKIWR